MKLKFWQLTVGEKFEWDGDTWEKTGDEKAILFDFPSIQKIVFVNNDETVEALSD